MQRLRVRVSLSIKVKYQITLAGQKLDNDTWINNKNRASRKVQNYIFHTTAF